MFYSQLWWLCLLTDKNIIHKYKQDSLRINHVKFGFNCYNNFGGKDYDWLWWSHETPVIEKLYRGINIQTFVWTAWKGEQILPYLMVDLKSISSPNFLRRSFLASLTFCKCCVTLAPNIVWKIFYFHQSIYCVNFAEDSTENRGYVLKIHMVTLIEISQLLFFKLCFFFSFKFHWYAYLQETKKQWKLYIQQLLAIEIMGQDLKQICISFNPKKQYCLPKINFHFNQFTGKHMTNISFIIYWKWFLKNCKQHMKKMYNRHTVLNLKLLFVQWEDNASIKSTVHCAFWKYTQMMFTILWNIWVSLQCAKIISVTYLKYLWPVTQCKCLCPDFKVRC